MATSTKSPVKRRARVDTAWFHERIKASPFTSIRQLAPRIRNRNGKPLTVPALSLALRGQRALLLDEARQLAELLREPVAEVLVRAGLRGGCAPDHQDVARKLKAALRDPRGRGRADRLLAELLRDLGYAEAAEHLDEVRETLRLAVV